MFLLLILVSLAQGPIMCGDALAIDGNKLYTAAWIKDPKHALAQWDLRSSSKVQDYRLPAIAEGFLYSCDVSGNLLAAGSGHEHCTFVFNTDEPEKPLCVVDGGDKPVQAVAFSPDGR